jgi:hypothetical protein
MVTLEKPKSISITISDRKARKNKCFVVYGTTIEEVEKKIKKAMEN